MVASQNKDKEQASCSTEAKEEENHNLVWPGIVDGTGSTGIESNSPGSSELRISLQESRTVASPQSPVVSHSEDFF